MVCDKVVGDKGVCQSWWVTKWCVKDGVCVCVKVVGDKVKCQKGCVTNLSVKDGV